MITPVQIAANKVGGVVALARQLGVKHPSLHSWVRVPDRHCLEIERITGISRHELRPDIFGVAPSTPTGEEAA